MTGRVVLQRVASAALQAVGIFIAILSTALFILPAWLAWVVILTALTIVVFTAFAGSQGILAIVSAWSIGVFAAMSLVALLAAIVFLGSPPGSGRTPGEAVVAAVSAVCWLAAAAAALSARADLSRGETR